MIISSCGLILVFGSSILPSLTKGGEVGFNLKVTFTASETRTCVKIMFTVLSAIFLIFKLSVNSYNTSNYLINNAFSVDNHLS